MAGRLKREIELTDEDIRQLDAFIYTHELPRRAGVRFSALRTKLEYALTKPSQRHEHAHLVAITVQSPIPGAPGSAVRGADVALLATGDEESAEYGQRPITASMSTLVSVANAALTESAYKPGDYVDVAGEPTSPRIVDASDFDL